MFQNRGYPLDLIQQVTKEVNEGRRKKPKPETNISNPSEITATDEQEVTLLVTLSSGGKMLNRAQSDNKEILPATFKWFHPTEGEITGNGSDKYRISSTTQQSVFVISKFAAKKDMGLYTCTVTNIIGSVNFTFQIDIKQAGPNVGLIVGATIGAIAAAVLIGVAIYFIVKYANKKKVQYHKEERQAAANGNPGAPADVYAIVNKEKVSPKEKDKAIPLEDTSTQKVSKSGDNEIQYAELPVLQKQGLKLPRVEVPNTLYSHIKTG
ncbi:V-set and immunoglobulin domain-containing protein 1-like [Protopterus annectens]|uniref:V-set and immunoglobulin domain-containing protein 1-like n=1 Tax=Protopterus annectens TaxID=7888 RepID=UPI001CFA5045|nr:V-set and immunoglobulin domain-containing protein 1-like [Protopterus annectens]